MGGARLVSDSGCELDEYSEGPRDDVETLRICDFEP